MKIILNFSNLFCWRLLRPVYAAFLKTGWQNSNAPYSGIYRYFHHNLKVVFSWPQRSLLYIKSRWYTLYEVLIVRRKSIFLRKKGIVWNMTSCFYTHYIVTTYQQFFIKLQSHPHIKKDYNHNWVRCWIKVFKMVTSDALKNAICCHLKLFITAITKPPEVIVNTFFCFCVCFFLCVSMQ